MGVHGVEMGRVFLTPAVLALAGGILLASALPADAGEDRAARAQNTKKKVRKYLSGKQVRELVSGRTTEWVALILHGEEATGESRRPKGRTYFSPDGTTEGTYNGRLRTGKWWLKKNRIFIKWDNAKDTFGAVLQPDGEGGHYRVRKKDGQKRSHWKTWFDGKQL